MMYYMYIRFNKILYMNLLVEMLCIQTEIFCAEDQIRQYVHLNVRIWFAHVLL